VVVIYIGVDVGLKGAISILGRSGKPLLATKLPVKKIVYGNKERGLIDMKELRSIILPIIGSANVEKERITAAMEFLFSPAHSKGNGLLFSGINYGRIWTTLELLTDDISIVYPKVWHKYFINEYKQLIGEEKDTKVIALTIAKSIFGEKILKATPRSTTLHDGIADSLLIAEYIRRRSEG
jgi:hypothetical protein